eukprot:3458561-Prymnesium_polylepis.1
MQSAQLALHSWRTAAHPERRRAHAQERPEGWSNSPGYRKVHASAQPALGRHTRCPPVSSKLSPSASIDDDAGGTAVSLCHNRRATLLASCAGDVVSDNKMIIGPAAAAAIAPAASCGSSRLAAAAARTPALRVAAEVAGAEDGSRRDAMTAAVL